MKYEIEIPDEYLTLKGKRYRPTGEYRHVKPGEYAISHWGGTVQQYTEGAHVPHIIVEEIVEPKPFLITDGEGLFTLVVEEDANCFEGDDWTWLKGNGWRRATPEECERMRSV